MEDGVFIALFVGALQARTKSMMAQRQQFFDEITGFARAYMGDAADKSIEPWGELADAGKHQIIVSAEAMATVAAPHMILLENSSPMPFIASDHPVVYHQLHVDELRVLGIPEEWLFREIPRSARHFFVLCPLTPRYAFIASRFIPPAATPRRATTDDFKRIFRLNELSRATADELIISSSPTPYGAMVEAAHEHDRSRASAAAAPRTGFSAYSTNERYWLSITALDHGMADHPLFARVTFRTNDMATLHAMAADDGIEYIEIFELGELVAMMRHLKFLSVAQNPGEDSILQQSFGGAVRTDRGE
jgi:hypothetical protein